MSQLFVNEISSYTGSTVIINGVTINNGAISATTYENFPTDVYVTGGTYSNGSATFTNNTGGTFTVTGFNTGGGGISFVEITYSDLVTTIAGSILSAGTYYMITDYKTCYDQPDFDVNGNSITSVTTYHTASIEPIIVLATSDNTLSVDAYQPAYPKDKIKYDYTFSATEITSGAAYGRITERIDEFNNRTDYDHRTILFKRYKTYFYELNNPLQGRIDINGTSVVGSGTDFNNDLAEGDVIYVLAYDKYFKIDSISGQTGMTINGNSLINDTNLVYYYAEPQIDGPSFTIPYTHTTMTDPPVDRYSEASLSDFVMDGAISGGTDYFGSGSTYFTNVYPGLFTMAAYDIAINTFTISGDLGADGGGDVGYFTYSTTGTTGYTAYVKKVYNAGDPSVNQIMVINTDGTGVQYNYSLNTNNAYQKLYYLTGATQLHYLVTSARNGIEITDENLKILIENYLTYIDAGSLSNTLSSLNVNYSSITNHIGSDLFLFNDVESQPNDQGGTIDDGGGDMFDGGNKILTDIVELGYDFRCYEVRNNNIPDDNFFFKEFKTFQCDYELENYGEVTSISNYIGNNSQFYYSNVSHSPFLLANNVFGRYSYSNTIGDRSYNNSTYNWFSRNKISSKFYNNRIYRGFYSNVVGEYFYENTFSGYAWRNNIGEDYNNNKIGNDFQNNVVRNSFNNNLVVNDFYKNSVGNGFNDNQIYYNFYGNLIGNAFNNNNIYCEFSNNTIGEYFGNNNLGDVNDVYSYVFNENVVGVNFLNNTIFSDFYKNHIGVSFEQNSISGLTTNNFIGNQFEYNTIYNNFNHNKISNEFKGNMMLQSFEENNTDSFIGGNQFSGSTYRNNIGSFTFDNDFFGSVNENTWKSDFYSNTIGFDFYNNSIGNSFYNNTIGNGFQYNQIGENFNNNNIGDNFGFGYSITQGNKIGNNFFYNTIGEYFYNNSISDNFRNNEVGDYFQWNVINTDITETNFTLNYGNITGFSYTAFGTSATDNLYLGVQICGATESMGVDATFDIEVSGGSVIGVSGNTEGRLYKVNDTLRILGPQIGGVTGVIDGFSSDALGKEGADGSYTDVPATGGNGGGASFDITVAGGVVIDIQLNNGGAGYLNGNTLTISGSLFGGVNGVDDITITVTLLYSDDIIITVTGVTAGSLFYDHYTKQIFERKGTDKRVSYYDENDILNIESIYEASGYIPVYSQSLIFPINNASFEFWCDGGYVNNGGFSSNQVNNTQELVALFNNNFRSSGYFFDNNDGTIGLYINPSLKQQYCPNGTYTINVFND